MDHFNNVKILYVDDEPANLLIFKATFQSKYKIFTASSGMEGLDTLNASKDDIIIVISDMRMPKMNGVQFIKKARAKYPNISYFILTGYDYNDEIDEAMKNNIVHRFFTKPFVLDELENAIQEAIERSNGNAEFP